MFLGSFEGAFAIGGYLSPSLAAAGEAIRGELPDGGAYTFSSRGPTTDGAIGPSFAAPGERIRCLASTTTCQEDNVGDHKLRDLRALERSVERAHSCLFRFHME